ncbi:peptide alpha-N-acetyltransferase complex A subunit NAT1, partial [Ascoidea rubescens DSM 1968]
LFNTREDSAFKEALKLYESKQYKKSLKILDQVLKKNSNHIESVCLKGLVLDQHSKARLEGNNANNSGATATSNANNNISFQEYNQNISDAKNYIERAIEKNALKNNPIVYHIIAIYYKQNLDYANAAKFYQLAVDNEAVNKNIPNDLSLCLSQLRDYPNLVKAKDLVLNNAPGYRANWTALSIAYHLNGDYNNAFKRLTQFEALAKGKISDAEKYEHSDCLLYKNSIIYESGNIKKALDDLEVIKPSIKDFLTWFQFKAKYFLLLKDYKNAAIAYRTLLKRNPDNISYYYNLEVALKFPSVKNPEKKLALRLKLYDKLSKFYPKSDPPKFIPLTFLNSENPLFKIKCQDYILEKLSRGVPSTFNNLKSIYKNEKKSKVIESIVLQFLKDLLSPSTKIKDPTVTAWTYYYLAQHYLYLNDTENAKNYIDKAIEHSPTLVELYLMKARIVKRTGDFLEASKIMNECRLMDLQDRFVNCKTAKYYLRANLVDEAIKTASIFTINSKYPNGLQDLYVMQSSWYIVEEGEAYFRIYNQKLKEFQKFITNHEKKEFIEKILNSTISIREYTKEELKERDALLKSIKEKLSEIKKAKGLSMKRFDAVIKIFNTYYNDQYDFHTYSMRKGTPLSYIEMVKYEDTIYKSGVFQRAIKGISDLYFEINYELKFKKQFENAEKIEKIEDINSILSIESDSELTFLKALKILLIENDQDPFGNQLISCSNPIEELNQKLEPLLKQGPNLLFTLKLLFRIYFNQNKFLLCFKSIKTIDQL